MQDDFEELAGLFVLQQLDMSSSERWACATALACLRTFQQMAADAGISLGALTEELVVEQFSGKRLPNGVMKRMSREIESHEPGSAAESLLDLRRIAARLVHGEAIVEAGASSPPGPAIQTPASPS